MDCPEESALPPPSDPAGERFCITTAINYANGFPHMGHAYEAVSADTIARYHRAYGREVLFMTGADEHGQKIADTARARGVEPIELCNTHVAAFQALNAQLGVQADAYIRTTSEKHKACARALFDQALSVGDIYLGSYEGWYNVREETFVTEKEAAAAEYKDPVSGKPLEKMKEESYFFRQSRFQERLLEHIRAHPEFIQPDACRAEIVSRLQREPLADLSVSRTTFDWGIPLPNDARHVMYVWFDALSNYLTGCDWPAGPRAPFWPASVHLIGKDIIWFHCVIWPCMLWSCDLPLPRTVFGHGFITAADGQKMSKSIGNVVDPVQVLAAGVPADSFRYYLLRTGGFGSDVPYSAAALAACHNADLADTLGNLLHRVAALAARMCGGAVPDAPAARVFDVALVRARMEAAFARLELQAAADAAIGAVKDTNKYLTDAAPWHAKGPDAPAAQAAAVRSVLEALYVAAHFLAPFLPNATAAIFHRLSTPQRPIWQLRTDWAHLAPGTPVLAGDVLFAKIVQDEGAAPGDAAPARGKAPAPAPKPPPADPNAPVDFSRLELRVGRVVDVKRHADAESLFVESIDLGEASGPRTIVSGLVAHYTAEELSGRTVVVLANIAPAKMRGVASAGMVLVAAAADGKRVELLAPAEGTPVGTLLTCETCPGQPDAQLPPKKKIWEAVQASLATDGEGAVRYKGAPVLAAGAAVTARSVPDGTVR